MWHIKMFTYHVLDILNEVNVFGKQVTRDTLKNNRYLIELAIKYLGTRVSVPTCQTHVEALYNYMEIPCPSNLSTCKPAVTLHILYDIVLAPKMNTDIVWAKTG